MIRSLCGQLKKLSVASPLMRPSWPAMAARASSSVQRELLDVTPPSLPEEEDPRYAPGSFLHHGTRLRYRNRPKFDSPRKKASKIYTMIMNEHIEKSKDYTPDVWRDDFRVGDAVELDIVEQGGIDTTDKSIIEKQRGVILGIRRKNMEFSVHIRDVIDGHAVEQLIPLHSPLVKKLTVLEKNFVHQGRKRVKRAKLYHMADWKPSCKSHDELSKSPPTIRWFSNLFFFNLFLQTRRSLGPDLLANRKRRPNRRRKRRRKRKSPRTKVSPVFGSACCPSSRMVVRKLFSLFGIWESQKINFIL